MDYEEIYYDDKSDVNEADEYLKNGESELAFYWACNHHERIDSPEIMERVVKCYEMCMNEGNPRAALNLGTLYYVGTYLKRDYKKAAELYEAAAKAGELRAICNLGYCYYYGRHCKADFKKAYEYFLKGALLHNDSNCLYKLGDMYFNGDIGEKNGRYAYLLYRRSYDAADEYEFCMADIKYRLGKCLFYGIGTEKDIEEAFEYISDALKGFYERRKTDPYVSGLIKKGRKLIDDIYNEMDKEIIRA